MDAPSMKVKCGVTNCIYNKANMCHADSITVNTTGDAAAKTSDGTCCVTFKPGA